MTVMGSGIPPVCLATRDNTHLYKINTRTNIQQVIYDPIIGGATYLVER